jgi:acyl carrier protein
MKDSFNAQNLDGLTIVIERFQHYLGTQDDLPLTSRLLDDLGLDSIGLVVTLLDISEQLNLDLRANQVDLSTIQTLEDVVSLIRLLRCRELAIK